MSHQSLTYKYILEELKQIRNYANLPNSFFLLCPFLVVAVRDDGHDADDEKDYPDNANDEVSLVVWISAATRPVPRILATVFTLVTAEVLVRLKVP